MRISVAIASYNGERFLARQLESILGQTKAPDEIVISDDGSSDQTLDLARSLVSKSGPPLVILADGPHLGYARNFERALRACTGEAIFLCDQDDVWKPRKIERMLERMGDALILFTDAVLVDADEREIHRSYSEAARIRPETASFARILNDNCVTGCTALVRRSLMELSPPFPDSMPHDQWLALLAADRGGIKYLDEALVLYRQHSGNVLGAGLDQESNVGISLHAFRRNREKSACKARWLRGILEAIRPAISGKNAKLIESFMRYHETMSRRGLGLEALAVHARYFRYLDFGDPALRRLLKLLSTPARAMFG